VVAPVVTCAACGLLISTSYLREAVDLTSWRASADERLTWLYDRMIAGDMPPDADASEAEVGAAPAAAQRPASAGSLLLAVGAFLLVIAGIAFLAFTWDLLGPFGQISVLLAIGTGCLVTTHRLAGRLHGTAVSLGIVGVFLVSIAALGARVLGPDLIGELAALLAAIGILAGLCVAARWLRPHTPAVAELAGVAGALIAMALINTAPVDGAVPLDEPWPWWVALWSFTGAAALMALANRMRLRSWPWVAAVYLVVGSVALGGWAADWVNESASAHSESLAFATVVAAASVGISLGLRRFADHRVPLMSAVLVVWSLALVVSWTTSISPRGTRGWSALVLVAVGAIGLFPELLGVKAGWQRLGVTLVGCLTTASAVGVAIPPYVFATVDADPQVWAHQAWPAWRGLLAGVTFVAVLAVTSIVSAKVADRARHAWVAPLLPLATTAAALGTWLITAQVDRNVVTMPSYQFSSEPLPTPDAYTEQIAVALGVLAIGVLVMALLRRVPAWSGWLVPALGIPAVLLELSTLTLDSALAPELIGITVALPALVAAVTWWWLRRPDATPTWQTIAPPFVVGVLPSTLALLQDTSQRWWFGEDPGTAYQVRMVALIAIAAVAAVFGARQRWSGLFFPGLVLAVVIVAVELVDLGRFLPQWVSFGVAGALLIAAGARWEWLRQRGRVSAAWLRTLR
jgi:hypothetical protein